MRSLLVPFAFAALALAGKFPCNKNGLHIIAASGAGNVPHGYGSLDSTVADIQHAIKGVTNYSVAYNKNKPHPEQLKKGVNHYKSYFLNYVKHCPTTPILTLGYSSGAIIMGDTLCGKNFNGHTSDPPLPSGYANHIIASVFFGDERYVPHKSWDRGTCTKGHGTEERTNLAQCKAFTPKWRSWVDKHDPECCVHKGGHYSNRVHHVYPKKYNPQVTQFVVSQYHKLTKRGQLK